MCMATKCFKQVRIVRKSKLANVHDHTMFQTSTIVRKSKLPNVHGHRMFQTSIHSM